MIRDHREFSRKILGRLCWFLGLVTVTACGGGGGGGGGAPPTPTPPSATLTFTPSAGPGQQGLSLQRSNVGVSELILDLRIGSGEDLYGLSFDLAFPSALLRFEDATEGDWLSASGGVQTSFLVSESGQGNLVVGITRLGDTGGRSGSGTLLSLRFTAIGSGNGSLQFSNNEFFDSTGSTVPGITWAAGSVRVQL